MNGREIVMTGGLVTLSACAATGDHGITDSSVRQVLHPAIESHLQSMVSDEHFSGVALVTVNGETIHASGYGSANPDRANDVGTAFHVASVTKQFTAAAVMQLVERGDVALDASINDYLPQAYRTDRWRAVTIHHLLSHSSGIPDYGIARDYYQIRDGFASDDTVARMILEARGEPLQFTPGTRYAYSNLGYALLGELIERVALQSYPDYVQQNLLLPMGMTSSQIRGFRHEPDENEATGFRWNEDSGEFETDTSATLPATPADAGLITTISDIARWSGLYLGEPRGVLSREAVSAMTTQQAQMGRGGSVDAYGYGIGVGERFLAHSGHVAGFRSQYILDVETNTIIAVFANNAAVNIEQVAFGILGILFAPQP